MTEQKQIDEYKEIVKIMKECTDTKNLYEVFTDFIKLMAYSISSVVDLSTKDERDKQYRDIAKNYTTEQLNSCTEIMALVTSALEKKREDVFGRLYMELGFGDKLKAQVFTPTGISNLMARLALDKESVKNALKKEGFVTIEDSACGGGSTLIQAIEVLKDMGVNPNSQILVFANDLDFNAVVMCYVQLSLLGVPAVIKNQDTLTLETYSTWFTPFFVWGDWGIRLAFKKAIENMRAIMKDKAV